MGTVTVRNLTIGQGIPKICIPIVAATREEILEEAREILSLPFDLVEWRCDWYKDIFANGTRQILTDLREILGNFPILCTFRTKEEGGAREASENQYLDLLHEILSDGLADLADLELFTLKDSLKELTATANVKGIKTIVSSHDFQHTPPKSEILRRFQMMSDAGADIAKVAAMPETPEDGLNLLDASREFSKNPDNIPVIAMSMGRLGSVSRLCGQTFGSSVTFGSARKTSAPGQFPARELKMIMTLMAKES